MIDSLERRPLVAEVLGERGDALVVAGLGSPTWDLFAAGDRPENLYTWGGMGLALPTALGLALAVPERRVLCITGDGEIMMGIGSLAVVANQAPENLAILVLDNESFGETGQQRGLTAGPTDIAAIAAGAGISATMTVRAGNQVADLAQFLFAAVGPRLAVAKIALTEEPWALPEKDGATIARRFREAIMGAPRTTDR